MHAVLGLATALGIVGASLGYGLLCLRLLRAGEAQPLAVTAVAGLALMTALGGWLLAGGVYSSAALRAGPARRGVYLWESWAPYFLDFLENEQQLAQRLGTQYRSRDVVVVDHLRSTPDGAPREEP